MAVDKLYKIKLVGLQNSKQKVLDFIHEKGIMHISSVDELDNPLKLNTDDSFEKLDLISHNLLELKWMKENLESYHEKKSLVNIFKKRDLKEVTSDYKTLRKSIYDSLISLIKDKKDLSSQIHNINDELKTLKSIPFNLNEQISYPQVNDISFSEMVRDTEYNTKTNGSKIFNIFDSMKDKISIVNTHEFSIIQGLKSDYASVQKLLKENNFLIIRTPELKQSKKLRVKELKSELIKLKSELAKIVRKLKILSHKYYNKVEKLLFDLSIFHDRYAITHSFLKSDKTFVVEGYSPKVNKIAFEKLAKLTKVHITLEEVEKAPTKLKNIPYVKNFEFITKMFGLPSYGRVDPTIYISIFLPFFFGFMFSDVGYGLMLMALSIFMLVKSNKTTKILTDAGIVMFVNSLSTIIFGLLFGSFFGNLIKITPILFDPFDNAKMILVAGLIIGLVHLNIGILIAIYEAIKEKRFKDVILSNFSVISLQVGSALMIFGQQKLGMLFLVLSVVLFVLKSQLMGLMDITGFVGIWFSYARLLALALATGGISLGINIMASQLNEISLLGPVLFVLLLIIGHTFNFVMNLLGSSIHSVRLHYIEFFSQFYEADGTPYKAYDTLRIKDKF